ncbi:MAG TPA: PIN domain-containing protein [Candidatus Angelobacter sp.]|jgi:predicted nucleic acid-binding protein|nr:PIN domain-containing protein [Candidatus Angelobacter sp.]
MALIFDTNTLLAVLNRGDEHYRACAALVEASREDLLVPLLTLPELDYFLSKYGLHQGWLAFLEDVDGGAWRVEPPTAADLRRARELQEQYRDLQIGVVDASIIALCERLGEPKVATLDRRHFTAVRPRHVEALRLLP